MAIDTNNSNNLNIDSIQLTDDIESIEETARRLLDLIDKHRLEFQGTYHHSVDVTLDSVLDRELGFDSLTMADLFYRIQQSFQVSLPQQLLARMETPRDLLREIVRANPSAAQEMTESTVTSLSLGEAAQVPGQIETLTEVLTWHVNKHPDRTHIYLYGDAEQVIEISYADLYLGASEIAAGLQHCNVDSGQSVAIMLPTCRDYFDCFFGILLAGCVPVPIYPPARPSQLEDHLRRHGRILNNAQTRLLLTVPEAKGIAKLLKAQVPNLKGIYAISEIRRQNHEVAFFGPIKQNSLDIAFLQYTSGSTGTPKGVILNHANLLANIRAMGRVMQVDSTDVFVSWLPLYHDMGLIASWLASLYFAMPLVSMSPIAFLTNPQRWLWAIHRHRGTLSAAPNFAYELCLKKARNEELEGLDLSCWRAAFNGAESVSPATIVRFTERFSCYGFRSSAMAPVYGLAESSVGLTLPTMGRTPVVDTVLRDPFMDSGKALPAPAGSTGTLEFVALGFPIPGHQVRIVDDTGLELAERQEGRLEFQGPSATSGYFRNAEASRQLFNGDWLDSGDMAYMAAGDLYVTGRIKDIIIRAGRNLYPHELEERVSEIDGIRKGCVAVFASKDPHIETERLVIMAETREVNEAEKTRLRGAISDFCVDLMGTPADDIVLAPPHSVLKTSSGKIRRAASRELYEDGKIGAAQRAVWLQMLRITLAAIKPVLLRAQRQAADIAYASYCWGWMTLLAPLSWLLAALLLPASLAWGFISKMASLWLKLCYTPVRVIGLEKLPRKHTHIFVANHASYLDGLILMAKLPVRYSFVAKVELKKSVIARLFLNKIGTEYVERFDMQKGVVDAHHLARVATAGNSLFFFPEGTFTRAPGLRPFHMGAFVAAVDARASIVPITMTGTRSKLRENSWFPRRGSVNVIIGKPVPPIGRDWAAAVQLRNRVREEILQHCGEPDLEQNYDGGMHNV